MTFFRYLFAGFAFTMGVELALGLCFAIGVVFKGANKE